MTTTEITLPPKDATAEELTESLICLSSAFAQVLSDIDNMPLKDVSSEFALLHLGQLTEDIIKDGDPSDRVASIIRFYVSTSNP